MPRPTPTAATRCWSSGAPRRRWRATTGRSRSRRTMPRSMPTAATRCSSCSASRTRWRATSRAIALEPGSAQAHANRGDALKELQRFADAIASYETALALDPGHKHAFGAAADCAMKLCDWGWREKHREELRAHITERTSIIPPFVAFGHFDDAALQLRCARNLIGDQIGVPPAPKATGPAWRHQRIKVAYLSADFRRHATAYLIAELIERHDRERFEVIGVSFGPDDAERHARAARGRVRSLRRRHQKQRRGGGGADPPLAGRHRRRPDGPHRNIRAPASWPFARRRSRRAISAFQARPAPTSSTTSSPTRSSLPFDRQPCFTEQIVHLPDCYQANDTTRRIAPRDTDAGGMRPAGRGLRLLLLQHELEDHAGGVRRLDAAARGDPGERAVAAARQRGRRGQSAPGGGGARGRSGAARLRRRARRRTSTSRATAWPTCSWIRCPTTRTPRPATRCGRGLPLLTCRGETFAARVAASLLSAVGLPELVTNSLEDYEALALKLATDRSLHRRFRQRLAANRATCPLFDGERFRRHIEAAYETMWGLWQRGERPRSFARRTVYGSFCKRSPCGSSSGSMSRISITGSDPPAALRAHPARVRRLRSRLSAAGSRTRRRSRSARTAGTCGTLRCFRTNAPPAPPGGLRGRRRGRCPRRWRRA